MRLEFLLKGVDECLLASLILKAGEIECASFALFKLKFIALVLMTRHTTGILDIAGLILI